MAAEYRGDRLVVYSNTLFINDDERAYIEFEYSGKASATVHLQFKKLTNPPAHPKIDVTGSGSEWTITFSGWNSGQAYAALEPLQLFRLVGGAAVSFSVCNTYLNGTNKLDIAFYFRA